MYYKDQSYDLVLVYIQINYLQFIQIICVSIMISNRNLHVLQQINVLHEMYYTINTQEYTGNILQ